MVSLEVLQMALLLVQVLVQMGLPCLKLRLERYDAFMLITQVFHRHFVIFGAKFKNTATSSVQILTYAHIQVMILQLLFVIFGIRTKIAQ